MRKWENKDKFYNEMLFAMAWYILEKNKKIWLLQNHQNRPQKKWKKERIFSSFNLIITETKWFAFKLKVTKCKILRWKLLMLLLINKSDGNNIRKEFLRSKPCCILFGQIL